MVQVSSTSDSKQGRRGRWLGRGKVTGDIVQDDAGKVSSDSYALGMPAWENPTDLMDAMPTTAMPDIAIPTKLNEYNMNGKARPQGLTEKTSGKIGRCQSVGSVDKSISFDLRSERSVSTQRRQIGLERPIGETRQKQNNKQSANFDKKSFEEAPHKIPVDDGYHNVKDFENMVIECDGTESSFGDITYDESIGDDEYYRNRLAHQRNNIKPSLVNPGRGNEKRCMQLKPNVPRSPGSKTRVERRLSNKMSNNEILQGETWRLGSNSIDGSDVHAQDRKLVEQEQAFVDFAADKSLQRNSKNVNSSFGLAEEQMGMGMNSAHTRDNMGFVWKREGKKWLKIPIGDTGEGNRQPIHEKMNGVTGPRGFDDSVSHASRNTQLSYNEYGIITPQSAQSNRLANLNPHELELLEQALVDEALQRSLHTAHQSSTMSMSIGSPSVFMSDRSPVPCSPGFPQGRHVGNNGNSRMLPPFAAPEHERPRAFASAEHGVSIQEREIASLAGDRNFQDRLNHSYHSVSSNASYESSRSGASFANQNVQTQQSRPPRPIPRSSSSGRLDGASGHLSMINARKPSTRAILKHIDYEEDEEELMAEHLRPSKSLSRKSSSRSLAGDRRVGDNAGISKSGVKLVWKRGPNNVWGKFPESDNDEDAAIQEAMIRSLIER